eukprot:m.658769 g.658769  ORF g.658769 m.658769 type:complete len:326 (+) comp22720_c1_seq15:211-1188(+)
MLTHHFPRAAVPIPNRISPVKSVFGFGHRFCSRRHPRMARGSMELPPWCRHTIPKLLVDRQSPMCCSDEQFLRYGATNVLFPFGYGLSYGDFTYSHLQHESTVGACDTVHISVTVTNSGQMRASEAVQVYIQWDDAPSPTPALQLVAFTKVAVDAGASVVVTSLAIPPRAFAVLTHAATNSSQFPSHRRGLSRLCGSRCGLVDSSRQRQELRRPHAHRRMFLPPPSPSPTPLLSRWTSVETVFRANLAGFKTTTAPPVTTSPRTPPALYARKVTAREMFPRTLLFQVWFGMIRRDTHIATPLYKDASCTHHGNGNVRNRITHNMV